MSIVTLRTVSNVAIATALMVAAAGCHKKVDAVDAGTDAAPAEVDAAPAPEASNEADVTRFPDETKLDHVAAVTQVATSNVRKAPPSGAIITTIPKGTSVVQIAQHTTFFLVTFSDPKDATKKLEGWVVQDAFSTTPPKKKPTPLCPAGQVLLIADQQDFCGHVCTSASDCPAGSTCSGQANVLAVDGGLGAAASTCVVSAADAGVVAVVDAGTVAVADAGAKGLGAIHFIGQDSGAGVPGQTIAGVQQPPVNGACTVGFAIADDKLCHHTCKTNGECSGSAHCTSKHTTNPAVGLCFP